MHERKFNSDSVKFGNIAEVYERLGEPITFPVGLRTLDLMNAVSGARLIDVAAGAGALAEAAAKRGLKALATDLSPEMVARAAARLEGYEGCEAREMPFAALQVADQSFDAAISVVGVLAFAEGREGLREMVRVTRPGGRIGVSTWDQVRPAGPQYLARDVFQELFPDRQLWPDDFFPRWTKEEAANALREAGCERVETDVFEGEWTVRSPATVAEDSSPLIGNFPGYRNLGEAEKEQFGRAFTAKVGQFTGPDGMAHIPTRAFVAVGTVAG